ncbi:hypothetical protein [Intrasporangium sp. YIM S08009]|uniref:hypothetical protein n=1 Tax=Intrasporangium zincisolvens TaxID=3080018 RepID=UPI002B061BA8|nr:hypothetical protein [Intrasporangium sp. YIM S08009]
MEFAIKFVATTWLDVDTAGQAFHDHFDGILSKRDGEWLITVYQEGPNARRAALAAVNELETLGFSVRRVDRDLVDIPEIAQRLGRKRQNIHQFVTGSRRASFPAPYAYLGSKRVWTWPEVVLWACRELEFAEESGLLPDDATFVDAYLADRRDRVTANWTHAVDRADRSSDKWSLTAGNETAESSYRRSAVEISVLQP